MNILIVCDLEGAHGIYDFENWVETNAIYLNQARKLFTEELNQVIAGFRAGGASRITVIDGHGGGGIDRDGLDRQVRYVNFTDHNQDPDLFSARFESGYDGIAVVGQHPKAGAVKGHLCHTGAPCWLDYRINGISVGEFGWWAFAGAERGIPTFFATGDRAFTEEAQALIPRIITVAVKEGLNTRCGDELDSAAYSRFTLDCVQYDRTDVLRTEYAQARLAMERLTQEPKSCLMKLTPPPHTRVMVFRDSTTTPPQVTIEHADRITDLLDQWPPLTQKPA